MRFLSSNCEGIVITVNAPGRVDFFAGNSEQQNATKQKMRETIFVCAPERRKFKMESADHKKSTHTNTCARRNFHREFVTSNWLVCVTGIRVGTSARHELRNHLQRYRRTHRAMSELRNFREAHTSVLRMPMFFKPNSETHTELHR